MQMMQNTAGRSLAVMAALVAPKSVNSLRSALEACQSELNGFSMSALKVALHAVRSEAKDETVASWLSHTLTEMCKKFKGDNRLPLLYACFKALQFCPAQATTTTTHTAHTNTANLSNDIFWALFSEGGLLVSFTTHWVNLAVLRARDKDKEFGLFGLCFVLCLLFVVLCGL